MLVYYIYLLYNYFIFLFFNSVVKSCSVNMSESGSLSRLALQMKKTGYNYPLNYGTVYNTENQGAFIMGIHHPVSNFDGRVIAVLSNRKTENSFGLLPLKAQDSLSMIYGNILILKRIFRIIKLNAFMKAAAELLFSEISKGEIRYLLIKKQAFGSLGISKGHIEMGETKEETALREVLEETGIHMRLIEGFECISNTKFKNRIEKVVSIFVGTTQDTSTSIQAEEIEDYIWLYLRQSAGVF